MTSFVFAAASTWAGVVSPYFLFLHGYCRFVAEISPSRKTVAPDGHLRTLFPFVVQVDIKPERTVRIQADSKPLLRPFYIFAAFAVVMKPGISNFY